MDTRTNITDEALTALQVFDSSECPGTPEEAILRDAWEHYDANAPAKPLHPVTDSVIRVHMQARLGLIEIEQAREQLDTIVAGMESTVADWDLLGSPDGQSQVIGRYLSCSANLRERHQRDDITQGQLEREQAQLFDKAVFDLERAKERERGRLRERCQKCKESFVEDIPSENNPDAFDAGKLKFPALHEAVLLLAQADDAPEWFYLHGIPGAGKTWTAVGLGLQALEWMAPYDDVRFLPASRLKDQLANIRDADEKAEFISELAYCGCLIIDDLFHAVSGPFLESLRRILAERGGQCTIITSNYAPNEVTKSAKGKDYEKIAAAVIRRILDRAAVVEFSQHNENAIREQWTAQGQEGVSNAKA